MLQFLVAQFKSKRPVIAVAWLFLAKGHRPCDKRVSFTFCVLSASKIATWLSLMESGGESA